MSDTQTERKRTPKPKSPRGMMPERPALERAKDFNEVATGYTAELAVAEAERCLQCKKPLCVDGCPVGIDIPAFIDYIADGDFLGGAHKIKEDTNLPAICGRVCPQETQC
jgi:glutamate synthase (NADPH) small chain